MPAREIHRDVTIRFPHIDAAGIVFYARYFELITQLFPDSPLTLVPFSMHMQIRRPNRLGDRITIRHTQTSGDWSYTGSLGGEESFSIQPLPMEPPALSATAHRDRPGAARLDADVVGTWSSGGSGVLQIPRYFEYINKTVEKWFESALKQPIPDMLATGRVGIPTVSFKTRCRALPCLGETFEMWMRVGRVGNKSLTLVSWLVRDGTALAETEQTIVFVTISADSFRSITMPDDIRARIGAYRQHRHLTGD